MRTTTRHTRPALAAAAVVATLLSGAAPTSAAPPLPAAGGSLDLTAGTGVVFHQVEIADDAVYYTIEASDQMWHDFIGLYGRTRVTTAAGTTLGPARLLDRIGIATLFAERDGTLAYFDAETGRGVLRAPDGTISEEAWADSPGVVGGVAQLTDTWLVGATAPWEPTYVLVDRSTGAIHDLTDLVTVPGQFDWAHTSEILVTDTQVAWSVYAEPPTSIGPYFTGVYTAPLTEDGPGAVTVLATAVADPDQPVLTSTDLIGLDGTRPIWSTYARGAAATPPCETTLSWYDAAPYTGTPATLPLGCARVVDVEGDSVATDQGPWSTTVITWRDMSSGATTATLAYTGDLREVRGTLAVTSNYLTGTTTIADGSGLPVTGDQTAPPLPAPFGDVRGTDPFLWEILALADMGIVGGYADGTFRPLAPVSRDAMAAFLYRAAGEPAFAVPATPTFTDVPAGHPFFAEVEWLAEAGITTGWAAGGGREFRPATSVTREAMAAFLYRFAHDGAEAPACSAAPFADVAAGQPFCAEVAWLADAGISQGWPDGTFRPALSIERQAMAAFLVRFLDLA